jgi:DNA-binding FrmR family transcriptional regulator
MTAARRALDKAFFDMLACVIEANVVEEAETKPVAERMAEVKALLTRYA